ncbi:unnamed protein product [Thelazia callipaeda]|uniref:Zonular occludens toxin n=1 Tax=Thelazia callipaeda TaxID=103827 RepID=A0A0N5D0D0_THECL|nr:unnamed protein product [Thelazia callipaeda]
MRSKNDILTSDFLTSKETYEKYERPHSRTFNAIPISGAAPVTYLNEYQVVTRTPPPHKEVLVSVPQQVISENELPSLKKDKIPFGRMIAAAVGIPLFIMVVLFIAIWFQELGFI